MALITRSVTTGSVGVSMLIPGFDPTKGPLVIPASTTLDLFTVLTEDQLEAIQPTLAQLVAAGELSVAATVDPSTFNPVGAASAIKTVLSSATVGGAATESVVVTGLLTSSTILAVSQSVAGANSLPLLAFTNSTNGHLTLVYSADMGAGAKVVVSFI